MSSNPIEAKEERNVQVVLTKGFLQSSPDTATLFSPAVSHIAWIAVKGLASLPTPLQCAPKHNVLHLNRLYMYTQVKRKLHGAELPSNIGRGCYTTVVMLLHYYTSGANYTSQ